MKKEFNNQKQLGSPKNISNLHLPPIFQNSNSNVKPHSIEKNTSGSSNSLRTKGVMTSKDCLPSSLSLRLKIDTTSSQSQFKLNDDKDKQPRIVLNLDNRQVFGLNTNPLNSDFSHSSNNYKQSSIISKFKSSALIKRDNKSRFESSIEGNTSNFNNIINSSTNIETTERKESTLQNNKTKFVNQPNTTNTTNLNCLSTKLESIISPKKSSLIITKNKKGNDEKKKKNLSVIFNSNPETKTKVVFMDTSQCKSISEYSILEQQNSLFRNYMEDYSLVIDRFANNNNLGFFIICDGHGGKETASYVINKLPEIFESEIRSIGTLKDMSLIENAYLNTFEKCDSLINTYQWSVYSGATCSCVFLLKFNQKTTIVTANIGDSTVVYVNPTKYKSKILSKDHKTSSFDEIERIKSKGGFISDGRLLGQLAISRSFGDSNLKGGGLISIPYVSKFDIESEDIDGSYIILASDGIWDELTEKDILEYSIEVGISKESSKLLGERVISEALSRGSTDNITVICIKI